MSISHSTEARVDSGMAASFKSITLSIGRFGNATKLW